MNNELEQKDQQVPETLSQSQSAAATSKQIIDSLRERHLSFSPEELEESQDDIKAVGTEVLSNVSLLPVGLLNVSNVNTIEGTDEDNVALVGTNDPDLIFGFGGNDGIFSLNGNDTVFGGTSIDIVVGGGGDDALSGDQGNDLIFGDSQVFGEGATISSMVVVELMFSLGKRATTL